MNAYGQPSINASFGRGTLAALVATASLLTHAEPAKDLTTLSLEQLLEVTIVGASKYAQKQSDVAAAVSVITRQEIQAFGWRTLGEALASLPGVHTTYDRQYTYLGARGFGLPGDYNTRVLVTINGNRVNDPVYDQGPIGREFPLDLDLIERIEFIPGPGGAVYGQNAMFGVVNVITRTGAGVDGVEAAAAYQRPQALRDGRISWGKRLDNGVDMLVSISAMRARGENRYFDFGAAGVAGNAVGLDGERDRELFARVARGAWSIDLAHGDRRKDNPTAAYVSDPLSPGQYQRDRFDLLQLAYEEKFAADTLQVSARLFAGRERYRNLFNYGTAFSFPADGEWRGAELRLLSTAVAGHTLLLGLEHQDNVRADQAIQDIANPANNALIAVSGYRTGVYVQDQWRFASSISATLGLRADRSKTNGTTYSPRVGLIWQAAPATLVKALYGRAHRAPNAYERDYFDGIAQAANPALKGEYIDTLELVADQRIGPDLTLRGSVYQWTMHNLITLGTDPVSGFSQYQMGERIKANGLELSADKTWALGARLRASASAQDVAYANGTRLLNSPKLLGKLNFSAPLSALQPALFASSGLRLGYEFRYDAKRLTVDGSKLGGYALSNLMLSSSLLAKRLDASIGIYNLFDKRFAHPGADNNWQNAFEQDGRSVRVKLSYRF